MRVRRRIAVLAGVTLVVGLTACTPALSESVVPGTEVVVGWTGSFTSTNAAASPTAGNLDIAAMTRGRFGDVVDGDFVADESFGTVAITGDDPFTVRYDLAEPAWSDGIPLDAADLLLGWADTAGYFALDEVVDEAVEQDAAPLHVPIVDEFARAIDVTYPQPRSDWQSAVAAPVPAHVLGALALGIDDPMEAKHAVITAISEHDEQALQKLATVWSEGFELDGGVPSENLLLSSGPFIVDPSDEVAEGGVALIPNAEFRGVAAPQIARIELVPPGDDPLAAVGEQLDVVQVAPTAANRDAVRALEREDLTMHATHDGTLWAMLLRPSGVFTDARARASFIHSAPARDLADAGAGEWAAEYMMSTAMTVPPESRVFDIVNEDSGYGESLGRTDADPAEERAAAGLAEGARVCVLYERGSAFAAGAFVALRDLAAEAGWAVRDCGADDMAAATAAGGWNAVITRVTIPRTPAEIAAQWGTGGAASITGHADAARDELIGQLAQTVDVYEARELHAQIEATIVDAAVAVPIAANAVITVNDRGVTGVALRNGSAAVLTAGASQWAVVP